MVGKDYKGWGSGWGVKGRKGRRKLCGRTAESSLPASINQQSVRIGILWFSPITCIGMAWVEPGES